MKRRKKSRADHVKDAAKALSDLNIIYGVIALMEGGLLSVDCQLFEARIVRLCQSEGSKCLTRYDAATAKATKP